MNALAPRTAVFVFIAFAFAYFLSALIRAMTATLSPVLTQEFALQARDLGLLAGGYFLGFSLTQLPLGSWLDRHGPKRVILCFLAVAVMACIAFSLATSFAGLLAARVLCGVGVSACLMAPLTGYRRWFAPATQMRSNSWMLMAASMGMVASTLPVQWLTPLFGWRPLFWALALMLLLAMILITWLVPAWTQPGTGLVSVAPKAGYAEVWRHPYFRRMVPVGFFCYGGLWALQTLWAAPWMIKVGGYSPLEAATGLFWINVAMLASYWVWGLASSWLTRRGLHADRLIGAGLPLSFVLLALVIASPAYWPAGAGPLLAMYCVACTFVTPSLPAIGMAFGPEAAGRALSAYNLVIFLGVFVIQWGVGLLIDGLLMLGLGPTPSFQLALAAFLLCCVGAYLHFLRGAGHKMQA